MSSDHIPTSLPPDLMWLHPSTPSDWPKASHSAKPSLITVLDSSFNPPTLAHLALASIQSDHSASSGTALSDVDTAKLLLFSLSNVEKKATDSDPSLEQRLTMVALLARHLPSNTAIGLINQATFVGKSEVIHSYFDNETSVSQRPQLRFIIGTDTLTRFFDPRFYTSTPGGMEEALSRFFEKEGSLLVSGRRGGEDQRKLEDAVMAREEVARWAKEGKISLGGTGSEDWVGMSSTKVREAVKKGDWGTVESLVVPEIAEYIREQGLYQK